MFIVQTTKETCYKQCNSISTTLLVKHANQCNDISTATAAFLKILQFSNNHYLLNRLH